MGRNLLRIAVIVAGMVVALAASAASQDPVAQGFVKPPESARPWVYWFWLNGNITREGITADLEAMKRVGIGGVLIMEVDQGAPVGPVDFASPKWRELFKHVCSEADRLGLKVNMNDDAGWNGSGGPWITPEKAMQRLVWSETTVDGGQTFGDKLAQPPTTADYYRDVAVLAFPAVAGFRIPDIVGKSALVRQGNPAPAFFAPEPFGSAIDPSKVVNLTSKMTPAGVLNWKVPDGKWTIVRFGYTPTGSENAPAPATGRGLECDKLSKEGAEAAFEGLMGKLIADVGPLAGKSLVSTHIDSWENGSQNWSRTFADEFMARRGYSLVRYLPVFTGRVVGNLETSERFLWDVRQTVGDLVLDNYAGHFRKLANAKGIRLSIEAYGNCVFQDMAFAGRADEPMAEFWSWPGNFTAGTVPEMVSAAHVYGKNIVGAEAFTATDGEKWLHHPGSIKGLGDWAFARGINRFVFHRYAMQPWLNVAPGMSMGPWGLHYERTQTWWEQSKAWHTYLARCQFLLQRGLPVVDLLYVAPEGSPSDYVAPEGPYKADACPAEVVLNRLSVRKGRLYLPDGMSYRVLVVPDTEVISSKLLARLQVLAEKGATIVVGKPPVRTPGLGEKDDRLRARGLALWNGGAVQVGADPVNLLQSRKIVPDFQSNRPLEYIHRTIGDREVYFVANTNGPAINTQCRFRVTGMAPELWDPETGKTTPVEAYSVDRGTITVPLRFEATQSLFVVFRPSTGGPSVRSVALDGKTVWPPAFQATKIKVLRAIWGPVGDPKRTKDVSEQVSKMLQRVTSFVVSELASEGDPAFGVVKTLSVEYEVAGEKRMAVATDPNRIHFSVPDDAPAPVRLQGGGMAEVSSAGTYVFATAGGKKTVKVAPWKSEFVVSQPWELKFPNGKVWKMQSAETLPGWIAVGASDFSGTATYTCDLQVPQLPKDAGVVLDLGGVEVMAEVILNGTNLGVLWHAPYAVDVTSAVRSGKNRLEVRVTNLWVNRMIADESLPEDGDRNPDGTLKSWPKWVLQGKKSPAGRQSFTSWKLWSKKDRPLPSGMVGPVKLKITKRVILPPAPKKATKASP